METKSEILERDNRYFKLKDLGLSTAEILAGITTLEERDLMKASLPHLDKIVANVIKHDKILAEQ